MSDLWSFYEMYHLVGYNKKLREAEEEDPLAGFFNNPKKTGQTPAVPLRMGQTPRSSVAATPKAFVKGKPSADRLPIGKDTEFEAMVQKWKKAYATARTPEEQKTIESQANKELYDHSPMKTGVAGTWGNQDKGWADRINNAMKRITGASFKSGLAPETPLHPVWKTERDDVGEALKAQEAIDAFAGQPKGAAEFKKWGVNPDNAKMFLKALDAVYLEGKGRNKHKNWSWFELAAKLNQHTGFGADEIKNMMKLMAHIPWKQLAAAPPFGASPTDPSKWAIYPDVQTIDPEERRAAGERGGEADPNVVGLKQGGGNLVGRSKITGTEGGVGSSEREDPVAELQKAMKRVRERMEKMRAGQGDLEKTKGAIDRAKVLAGTVGGRDGHMANLELDQIGELGDPEAWRQKMRSYMRRA